MDDPAVQAHQEGREEKDFETTATYTIAQQLIGEIKYTPPEINMVALYEVEEIVNTKWIEELSSLAGTLLFGYSLERINTLGGIGAMTLDVLLIIALSVLLISFYIIRIWKRGEKIKELKDKAKVFKYSPIEPVKPHIETLSTVGLPSDPTNYQ